MSRKPRRKSSTNPEASLKSNPKPPDDPAHLRPLSSVEAFLERTEAELEREASASHVARMLDAIREHALDEVRRWCFANREAPHACLPEALDLLLRAMEQGSSLHRLLALETPALALRTRWALDQLQRFMARFRSADELVAAMDMNQRA